MAIGVRILSDNLSGLTTNVTYLPISGGTIDLGVQTFPFNYISDYYLNSRNQSIQDEEIINRGYQNNEEEEESDDYE